MTARDLGMLKVVQAHLLDDYNRLQLAYATMANVCDELESDKQAAQGRLDATLVALQMMEHKVRRSDEAIERMQINVSL